MQTESHHCNSSQSAPAAPAADARWQAVLARDAKVDGQFYYSVATTGVFCKPSCPSRQARREHVCFHDSIEAALAAGFRPCRRCKPEQAPLAERYAGLVAQACRKMDEAEAAPELAQLAAAAGLSPYHFHRIFKQVAGMTPRVYAIAARQKRLREALPASTSVTTALYDAGFQSSGSFYAGSAAALGMRPAAYRAGGAGTEIRYALGPCSLGLALVAATPAGLCAILLGDDAQALETDLRRRFPRARLVGDDEAFARQAAQAVALVDDPGQAHALPLDVRGTVFQQRVWQALREVPPGTTVSYAELAQRIGCPQAVRAVAGACAANPLAVLIPCHRVLRSDGSLSGYRWGVQRKQALLAREARRRGRGEAEK